MPRASTPGADCAAAADARTCWAWCLDLRASYRCRLFSVARSPFMPDPSLYASAPLSLPSSILADMASFARTRASRTVTFPAELLVGDKTPARGPPFPRPRRNTATHEFAGTCRAHRGVRLGRVDTFAAETANAISQGRPTCRALRTDVAEMYADLYDDSYDLISRRLSSSCRRVAVELPSSCRRSAFTPSVTL